MATRVARRVVRIGKKRHESRREIVSALATGVVESRLRNLPGGDADSAGWRQERASLYPNPTNLNASINRYYDETTAAGNGRGIRAGELSARVQRPAAQYRGRYQDAVPQAKRILRRLERGGARSASATKLRLKTTPAVDRSQERKSAVANYLLGQSTGNSTTAKDPFTAGADESQKLLDSVLAVAQAQDTPKKIAVSRAGGSGGAKSPDAPNSVHRMLKVAVGQSKRKRPYQWGGGHGSTPAKVGAAVDCSGYWSMITGLSPRVSGQFAKWGKPGKGKSVTVYANDGHVLGSIRDPRTGKVRWFATSSSNPGGGAGEIAKPSAAYLSRFTARHPRGL